MLHLVSQKIPAGEQVMVEGEARGGAGAVERARVLFRGWG